MLGPVAVQNQQELSAAMQRSLDTSAYGSIAVDKGQLWGVSPHQSLSPTLAPGSGSNSSQTLGTPSEEVPDDDRLNGEGVQDPKILLA